MYEVFEHTADLGLRVRADSLEALLVDAARGLFSLIVADLASVRPVERVTFEIKFEALDLLLFDCLNELLYLYETRHLVFGRFEVSLGNQQVALAAHGEIIDPDRHQLEHEVKAITYHGLKVERTTDGWLAEVIVDI